MMIAISIVHHRRTYMQASGAMGSEFWAALVEAPRLPVGERGGVTEGGGAPPLGREKSGGVGGWLKDMVGAREGAKEAAKASATTRLAGTSVKSGKEGRKESGRSGRASSATDDEAEDAQLAAALEVRSWGHEIS